MKITLFGAELFDSNAEPPSRYSKPADHPPGHGQGRIEFDDIGPEMHPQLKPRQKTNQPQDGGTDSYAF